MHPEMSVALDNLTRDLAHKHQVSTSVVNLLIQGSLLRTKLAVLGATVVDKKGKIDVRDSCEKLVTEVLNLCYIGMGLEITEQKFAAPPPAQVRITNLATEVEAAMQPIINHYFMGIEEGRKPS